MEKIKKIFKILVISGLIALFILISVNIYIIKTTENYIYTESKLVPSDLKVDAVLVLGAKVYPKTGRLSDILKDRVDTAVEIYRNGNAEKFLLSGDHGQVDYDEVNVMKDYLLNLGIPEEDIFLDHAGFDTYDSVVRAKEVFEVKSVIISTQKFHLYRAIYISRKKGMQTYGVVADKQKYVDEIRNNLRESLARTKSFFDILLNASPKFLGETIPITGAGQQSFD